MFDGSFVKRTGQLWKLVAGVTGVIAAGAAILIVVVGSGDLADAPLLWTTGFGLALGVASLAWLALAMRCPRCGCQLGWTAMKTGSGANVMGRLLTMSACPSCGASSARA